MSDDAILRPADDRGNLIDVWLSDDEFWMLLTGQSDAPSLGITDKVSPRWIAWAKRTILTTDFIPPRYKKNKDGVGRDEALAIYLCRLMRILDCIAGSPGSARRESAELENLLLGAAHVARLEIDLFRVGGQRYGQDAVLSNASDLGMIQAEKVDLWHAGMASGSGWTTLYSLMLLGRRKADCDDIVPPYRWSEQEKLDAATAELEAEAPTGHDIIVAGPVAKGAAGVSALIGLLAGVDAAGGDQAVLPDATGIEVADLAISPDEPRFPAEIVDDIDQELLAWLKVTPTEWTAVDTDKLPKTRAIALRLLVWSGLLELKLDTVAWCDGGPGRVRAECIVSGRYDSLIARAVGDVAPPLRGQVFVQPATVCHCRLTLDGIQARADAADALAIERTAVLIAAKAMVKGRVGVRVLDLDHSGKPATAVAAAQAVASASVGNVNVMVNIPAPVAAGMAPAAPAEAAVVKKARKSRRRPDRRCGDWHGQRVTDAVDAYMKEHWAELLDLGNRCLASRPGAVKALNKVFGPKAIAAGINKAQGITDPLLSCGLTHVSENKLYRDWTHPLRKKPPELPAKWPKDARVRHERGLANEIMDRIEDELR